MVAVPNTVLVVDDDQQVAEDHARILRGIGGESTFGGNYVLLGSQHWKIQGNWSNYDFDHNTGYANSSGQKGCADGTNYPGPYTR